MVGEGLMFGTHFITRKASGRVYWIVLAEGINLIFINKYKILYIQLSEHLLLLNDPGPGLIKTKEGSNKEGMIRLGRARA